MSMICQDMCVCVYESESTQIRVIKNSYSCLSRSVMFHAHVQGVSERSELTPCNYTYSYKLHFIGHSSYIYMPTMDYRNHACTHRYIYNIHKPFLSSETPSALVVTSGQSEMKPVDKNNTSLQTPTNYKYGPVVFP